MATPTESPPFGGISVLLNVDHSQLPPPGDASSYKEISSTAQGAQALDKTLLVSFFTTVLLFEPEVTQRQWADPPFTVHRVTHSQLKLL